MATKEWYYDKEENRQEFLEDMAKRLKSQGLYTEKRMAFCKAFIEGKATIGCEVDSGGNITNMTLEMDE